MFEDGWVDEWLHELENDPSWEERWAQDEPLWLGRTELTEPLVARLTDTDDRTRRRAVTALGWVGDERAVDALVAVLNEADDEELLTAAVTALGDIGQPSAVQPLLDAFESGSSAVRSAAVRALGDVGATDELERLVFDYEGNDAPTVRRTAIRALGTVRDEQATRVLLRVFDDGTVEERRTAAWGLGVCLEHGTLDDRVFTTLLDLLDDGDSEVRMWAAVGLASVVETNRAELDAGIVFAPLRRLVGRPADDDRIPELVESLVARLDDESPRVRQQSVRALGRLGSCGLLGGYRRRVRSKVRDVSETDESADVRSFAASALRRLGG